MTFIPPTIIKLAKEYRYTFISVLLILCYIVWELYTLKNSYGIIERKPIKKPNYPPIKRFENVFSIEECKQIIDFGRPRLFRSKLDISSEGKIGKARTSKQAWIKPSELPCITRVSKFVANT